MSPGPRPRGVSTLAVSALVAASVSLASPEEAHAANVLFVSDFSSDTAIVPALSADGHSVTMVVNDYSSGANTRLRESLAGFDVVYWSATGGQHTDPSVFANLTDFVTNGGRIFVTGYNSLTASPTDAQLISFLGGTGSRNTFNTPGAIAFVETSLTVGVVDIRGVSPTGSVDNDCLTGLGADTVVLADNGGDPSCGQWTLRTLGAGQAAYVSNSAASAWTTTSGGGASAFNAAIRNFARSGESGTSEPGAPDISIGTIGSTSEGDSFEVQTEITDAEGDAFTFSWDLDGDGTYGERPGELAFVVPAGTTDGPEGLTVGIEAVDDEGHRATRSRIIRVTNVAPEVTSEPPTVASILADLEYRIVARDPAGELDPLTFELVEGPDGMSVTDAGMVSWIPDEADITAPDEAVRVEVRIDDGDGGETVHAFDLEVSRNRRPSTPMPSYPTELVALIDTTPRLAAQNGEDLDLDPLTYAFELDEVETFDSPALRRSAEIAEMPGFTSWQLEDPLALDRRYYWRVRADDGTTASPWRGASFYVVRDPSLPPPDAGVADGGVVRPDGALIPGIDAGTSGGGGGCAVRPGETRARGLALAVAVGLLTLARRRRARR